MTPPWTPASPGWCLIVPVKALDRAKTRLSAWLGSALPPAARQELALAFAVDTIQAATRCPEVSAVVVVTDDRRVADALASTAVTVVPDLPAAGLNAALRHGARIARHSCPAGGIGALSADLPALRPTDLAAVLRAARGHDSAMVADMDGSGTTLFLTRSARDFTPSFGAGSRGRHIAAGAVVLGENAISLRCDVDTMPDLDSALGLGVGAATSAQAARLPGRRGVAQPAGCERMLH